VAETPFVIELTNRFNRGADPGPTGALGFEKAKSHMPVLKPRSMLVTFRVSAEEHEQLAQSCLKSGARSIADFVRAAALQQADVLNAPGGNLSGDLMTLSKGLRELDVMLGESRKRIRTVLGPIPQGTERVLRPTSRES